MNQSMIGLFKKYIDNTASADEQKALNDWISTDEGLQQWLEEQLDNSPEAMDNEKKAVLLEKIHEKTGVKV